MKYSRAIKPISYLKTHASEIIRDISDSQATLIITHNGKAKVVLQDVRLYERNQESIALLKMLATSGKNLKRKHYKSLDKAFKDVRKKIDEFQKGVSETQS